MAHEGGYGDSPHMKTIALSILVMGISLAIVIVLYVSFGYMPGSNFSNGVMENQQEMLREQYGLPPAPEVSEDEAEIPPSLRGK
jgi:hypothetical protein